MCAHMVFKVSALWKSCLTLKTSICLYKNFLAYVVFEVTALCKSFFALVVEWLLHSVGAQMYFHITFLWKFCSTHHAFLWILSCMNMHILRFMWPCKSGLHPIFPKMQCTHSLFAKLWFVRPLIFQIRDSSPQYLSNVTFGTSFAIQMREEYDFEKNIFWKLDFKGGK